MTRLVLNANVVVSALLFRGEPARLLDAWQAGRFRLAVSRDILAEYFRVLAYCRFGLTESEAEALAGQFVLPYCDVFKSGRGRRVCRDRDDDKFLHCVVAAAGAAIVSGDRDVLDLGPDFGGVPILTVRQALDRF